MNMKTIRRGLLSAIAVTASCAMVMAQGPGGAKGKGGPPRPVLSVRSPAWADGGEVPMHNAGRGENKSPEFEFHWSLGNNPTAAPEALQTYAIIFHDIENSSNKTTVDTLHWSAFNIPGTTKTLARGTGIGGSARRDAQWSWHPGRQGHTGLFRTRRRPRAVPSLRVRVLRPGHKAGSAGNRVARRVDEGHGRPRHRQGGVCRPLPRAAAVSPS